VKLVIVPTCEAGNSTYIFPLIKMLFSRFTPLQFRMTAPFTNTHTHTHTHMCSTGQATVFSYILKLLPFSVRKTLTTRDCSSTTPSQFAVTPTKGTLKFTVSVFKHRHVLPHNCCVTFRSCSTDKVSWRHSQIKRPVGDSVSYTANRRKDSQHYSVTWLDR
jgi:hypothetical protein